MKALEKGIPVESEKERDRTSVSRASKQALHILLYLYWAFVAAFVLWRLFSLKPEVSPEAALIALAVLIPASFALTVGYRWVIRLAARLFAPLMV